MTYPFNKYLLSWTCAWYCLGGKDTGAFFPYPSRETVGLTIYVTVDNSDTN